jgi:hypothetical protein
VKEVQDPSSAEQEYGYRTDLKKKEDKENG